MNPRRASSIGMSGSIALVVAIQTSVGGCAAPERSQPVQPVAHEPGPDDRIHPGIRSGPARPLTDGPRHHFFGYYGISPWNPGETMIVGLETTYQDRLPRPGERAVIGLIDPTTRKWTPLTQTRAWNFQQGCMLHWLDDREIIFNDRRDGRIVSVILDVRTRRERMVVDRPVAAVSRSGKVALGIDFARMGRMRSVVGVAGGRDRSVGDAHPDDNGVWRIDLTTGESRLVVTLDQFYRYRPLPPDRESDVWVNHVLINRNATRFLALVRRRRGWHTMMFTAGLDGADLRCVLPSWSGASHFDWASPTQILATFRPERDAALGHYLFTDGQAGFTRLGDGLLDYDGHASVSPRGRWVVTDSYPRGAKRLQQLVVYDLKTGMHRVLGLYAHPVLSKKVRCDLHPRWSPSGRQICFDSAHGAQRQMYVIDVILPK